MSDNIPFEMQMEIMKRLPVKSLIQFRSVSKAWKSAIDSSSFIADYRGPVPHLLVRYDLQYLDDKPEYVSIVDDDTFPGQKVYPTVPRLVKMLKESSIIGCSHGFLCFYGYYDNGFRVPTAVLWNISIRKAFDVVVPNVAYQKYTTILGFGVCRETCDPKIIKITHINSPKDMESISCIPWQVEVFTLSTGVWRTPYTNNLPRRSITFTDSQIVKDGFLYWIVTDWITTDGGFTSSNLIISFDITSEEFTEISLSDALAPHQPYYLSMCKVRESLVVLECNEGGKAYIVWMMEDGVLKSFTKILTICTPGATILSVPEFRKSGEPLVHILDDLCDWHKDDSSLVDSSLVVYEPYSKHITNLGISGNTSFSVYSYMETLLLLDQPDYDV